MSHKSSTPGCEGTKYLPHGVTTEHFQEGLSTIGLGVRAKKDTTPRHTFCETPVRPTACPMAGDGGKHLPEGVTVTTYDQQYRL